VQVSIDRGARLQQLDLDLVVGAAPAAPYSSGLVPTVAGLPALSIAIEKLGEFCFETRFSLDARPRPRATAPGLPADAPGAQTNGTPAPPTSWGTLKSAYDTPH